MNPIAEEMMSYFGCASDDETLVHMEQLEVYAALFCLEYKIKPSDIYIELRIYQNDQILYHNPTAEDIISIMDKIIHLDKLLEKIDYEER